MHYLFCKLLLENPPLKNLNINIGTLKCCVAMYLSFDLCFYLLIVFVCMCVPRCIQWCACGLQRTACGSWFSFSTLPGLTASTITCWAILPASFINRLTRIWTFTNYFPDRYLFFMVKESHRILPLDSPHPGDLLLVLVSLKFSQTDASSWGELLWAAVCPSCPRWVHAGYTRDAKWAAEVKLARLLRPRCSIRWAACLLPAL